MRNLLFGLLFLLGSTLLAAFSIQSVHAFFVRQFHLYAEPQSVFVYLGVAFSGSMLLLQQLYFIRRVEATEASAQSQADRVIHDRFNSAITHLNSPSEGVRIGGIYSLAFLAQEEQGNYLKSAIEILCGHIRTTTQNKDYLKENFDHPSTEIQTPFNVLFLNGKISLNALAKFKVNVDLNSCFISGLDFTNACLQKVDFSKSKIFHVTFSRTQCQRANFNYACFYKSSIHFSDCTEATFYGSYIFDSILNNNRFFSCNFMSLSSCNSTFRRNSMQASNFNSTSLYNCTFVNCNFCFGSLHEIHIDNCKFKRSHFYNNEDLAPVNFTFPSENASRILDKVALQGLIKGGPNKNQFSHFYNVISELKDIEQLHVYSHFIPFLSDTIEKIEQNETSQSTDPSECKHSKYSLKKSEVSEWLNDYKKSLVRL